MPHELSSASILKPPRFQGQNQMNSSSSSLASMNSVPMKAKSSLNRLVPVPPPKGWMPADTIQEEEKQLTRGNYPEMN